MPNAIFARVVVVASLLTAGCSPLGMFDTLVPKDRGTAKVASAVAYGSEPRQMLDVYAPHSDQIGGRPVIVFFYGGSWNSGTRSGYAFVGRALAAQGFLVVIPDYRLVPAVRYPAFIEDGAAAVRWAKAHVADFGGDPARIVLMGHSAGAYIAAMLAVDDRWLKEDRRAVRGFVGLAGPYDFAPFDVEASRAAFGAWPRPNETQPVIWAGAGDPPALLLVGADDTTVRPRNSEALGAKLRDGGVSVDLQSYSQTGHVGLLLALARPFRGRQPVLKDIVNFVRKVD
ncbi:alpha/beta hydrolase [Sphingomonas radiodurans]|uniref:alpha/beta hydrolase n=1 Tax=Sphingomonas radiodurans TaxID=2890321 RepID=UPI001E41F960|nr:alpha/beta hydrolase [Sphingomonas radiodurans]WBH15004.1 alpha/beta hydrolase [Sphingomonas radiodurans]